ncbi:MAG: double-cubane-cluster-containing anaerobic reductase [Syntrophobacteraceae bacterium]|nr:double-cubane-cluster-containing anaerobic reductase [Syntrophobacteraceae bacterium]
MKLKPDCLEKFQNGGERFLLDISELQDKGQKVAGIYCLFAPVEIVRAAGAIPVSLCGKKEKPIADAEKTLPANLCPLIKSSYGYAVTDTCPFFSASDILIGETTCDGKKKMYEFLGRIKPLHLMHLPYSVDQPGALRFWHEEILRLAKFIEESTGQRIDNDHLRFQIHINNKIRKLLSRISRFQAAEVIPISGLDMMSVMETKSFSVTPEDYISLLQEFIAQMEDIAARGFSPFEPEAPRILLTGSPVGKGCEKVLQLIEECGGAVVCMENCTGVKGLDLLVDERAKDPFLAIARRYLQIPCSCMSPNIGRMALLGNIISEFHIDAVVDLSWQCCHTYNIESRVVGDLVENGCNLPFLHIETDYGSSDLEQLRTRIEAFLEMTRWQPTGRGAKLNDPDLTRSLK